MLLLYLKRKIIISTVIIITIINKGPIWMKENHKKL